VILALHASKQVESTSSWFFLFLSDNADALWNIVWQNPASPYSHLSFAQHETVGVGVASSSSSSSSGHLALPCLALPCLASSGYAVQ
jgi:hypothetical protein